MSAESSSCCCEEGFPLIVFDVNPNDSSIRWDYKGPCKVILPQYPRELMTLNYQRTEIGTHNMMVKFDNNLHEVSQDYSYEINLKAFYSQYGKSYHVPLFSATQARQTGAVIFKDMLLEVIINLAGFTDIRTYYNTFCLHGAEPLHVCCEIRRFNTRFNNNFALPYDELFRQQGLSDVCLKVGDREFQVHRAILAVHSSVFRAMFSHADMTEGRTGLVVMNDIEAPVLEEMLDYVYTGHVNDGVPKYPVELLKAAHMYDIAGLVDRCEEALMFDIRFANVVELLELANLYGLEALKSGAMSFIDNHEEEMVIDPKYQTFLLRELSIDTLAYALKLCDKYELPELKAAAFEFVKRHSKQVSCCEEYLNLLETHPQVMREIFVYIHQCI